MSPPLRRMLNGTVRRAKRLVGGVLAARREPPSPASAPDRLDAYASGIPSPQATLDIFKGAWSSRYPAHFGVQAGSTGLFEDARIQWLLKELGGVEGYRVLELGPLEGAHSFMLERAGVASVVAVEACVLSYLKCLITKELTGLTRASFQFGDFMPYLENCERFDLVLASGVLYHQADPVLCLKRVADCTDKVFIWTHYFDDEFHSEHIEPCWFTKKRRAPLEGFGCDWYRLDYDSYLGGVKYRGGVNDHVHWLRRDDLLACLAHFGFNDIRVAFDQREHPYGPNISLLARRNSGEPARAPGLEQAYAMELRRLAGPVPWCIDSLVIEGDSLIASGWAIPVEGNVDRTSILVNGKRVADLMVGIPRKDVGTCYWYFPSAERAGFRLRHRLDDGSDVLRLSFADRDSVTAIESLHDFCVIRRELASNRPVPGMDQIRRVHGGNTQNQFLVEGSSLFVTLEDVLHSRLDSRFADFATVLDFGCGCGRLSRYLAEVTRNPLIGLDIDAENVAWCRRNLAGDFRVIQPYPPTELAAASIDCVLAIQVFTHLTQANSHAWLAEIGRLCRPGALVIASVAATRALTRAMLSRNHYASVKSFEFLDLSRNPDLDGVLPEVNYYRNVFCSHEYVLQEWPRHGFQVLDIVSGAVGNHHDLVLMRRKAAY